MGDPRATGATIKVNGLELRGEAANADSVIVDEDLQRPAMFAITLVDPKHTIVEESGLQAGAAVEITMVGQGVPPGYDGALMIGEVVSVECDYDEVGADVVIRGYAASHRLHRGRRTRVFKDSTDSDIVKQVAAGAGLDLGEIEPTSEVHQHITQGNLTDWEFLASRTRPLGLDLTVTDGRLHLRQRATAAEAPADAGAPAGNGDPRHLIFRHNLKAFHGRMSAADQVADVEIRGWDQGRKQPVVGKALARTGAAKIEATDPPKLAAAFRDPTFVDVVMPVSSDREAEDAASALAERIGSAFVEAEGTALGNTALRAGAAVRVSGVSAEFNGAYVLSHVRHVLDDDGYRTHFTIGGHHDRSLLGLVAGSSNGTGHRAASPVAAAVGLVRGVVSEVDDPDKQGRVKVKLPWLDAQFSSAWAPVMQLGAGPDSGTFFLPAVGDEVLVGFEHGLIDRPMVVGGLFNGIDKPPTYGLYLDNGAVTGRAIHSRSGHELSFHDARDRAGIVIRVVDSDRQNVVSVGLNALEEKLVVFSAGAVEVRADGDVSLHGKKVSIEADTELVLKGATIKLN